MMPSARFFTYSITHWCLHFFGAKQNTQSICATARALNASLDLPPYDQWGIVVDQETQISCILPEMGKDDADADYPPFVPGFNNPAHFDRVYDAIDTAIDKAASVGAKNVIVFTGFDTGADRDDQFDRIVDGFTGIHLGATESLVDKAARLGIVLVIEMLNTIGNPDTWEGHPGYLGNNTDELVAKVVEKIDHPNFGLAFDVYHILMMHENLSQMIENHHQYVKVIHVAGVARGGLTPMIRGELHVGNQETNWPIAMALLAKYVPKGTTCLLEYKPQTGTEEQIRNGLNAVIDHCESQIFDWSPFQ